MLITSAVVGSLPAIAAAQTDGGLLFNPWREHQVVDAEGSAYLFPSTGVSGGRGDTNFSEVRSSGRFRVDPDMKLSPSLGYETTDLFLGRSLDAVPHQLADSSVGFGTPIAKLGENSFVAASAAVGYAGGDPFGVSRAWYGKAAIYVGKEIDDHHALLAWVDYDGNRDLFPDIPLPGFAYAFDASPIWSFVLGFPVASVTWHPTERFKFELDVDLPDSVDATATYTIAKPWSVFASYATSVDSFHVSELPNNDRLFFNEQRLELGLTWKPTSFADFTVAGGYAFDRSFQAGFDVRDTRRVFDLADAPYARVGLSIQF